MSRLWNEESYLRSRQYVDASNLNLRTELHQKYGTARIPWTAWLSSLINWTNAADVLEVGCGAGVLWKNFLPEESTHLRVVLTDLSKNMVAEAHHFLNGGGFEGLNAICCDVVCLPVRENSFDVVAANHVLYHVPVVDAAIDEISRVLRSNGTFLAATNGPENFLELKDIRRTIFGSAEDADISNFDRVSGAVALGEVFSNVEWHEYHDQLHCTDIEDVVRYVTSSPPGESASTEQIDELRELIRDSMVGGRFTITKDTGAFLAWGV